MSGSSSVPQPTLGPNGFVSPLESDILAGTLSDTNSAFGGILRVVNSDGTPALTTPQGQLSTSEAALIAENYDLFAYYVTQVDPAYAQGRMQDAIARINFLTRNPPQPTTVLALCTGLLGVVIPVGATAVAADGNLYVCTTEGTIPSAGNITLPFACSVTGPIPCPTGSLTQIYQTIPGWDSITNVADGTLGTNVESRAAFELRRQLSVALNSVGPTSAVQANVLRVSGVTSCYVRDNSTNAPVTVGGVTIAANSIYVCVAGGASLDVATAIWQKKSVGCSYTGTTTVTVYDESPGYSSPFPSYAVSFTYAAALQTYVAVTIKNGPLVPSNALALIQQAVVAAATGADGLGPPLLIGSTVFASRFYAGIQALGSWAQIVDILIGSPNSPAAAFTGSIAASVLTVSAVASGTLVAGQVITGASVLDVTVLGTQISGTAGGTGTYNISPTQTVASESMAAVVPTLNLITPNINQIPIVETGFVTLTLA